MNLSFDIERLQAAGIEVTQRDGRIVFEHRESFYVPLFDSAAILTLSRKYGAADVERILDVRGYEIMKELFMIELRQLAA